MFVFSVYIEKKPPTLLSLHIYNSRASAGCSRVGARRHTHADGGGGAEGQRTSRRRGGGWTRGPGKGCPSPPCHGWCLGLHIALDANFHGWAVPTVPTVPRGSWPRLLHREQDLGRCVPGRPPGMKYCTRAKTKQGVGGRVSRGAGAHLGVARCGRRGLPGGGSGAAS